MPTLARERDDALDYDLHLPASTDAVTFVGINALTGDRSMWEGAIGDRVRGAGHGTLFWNLRGQAGSPAGPDRNLGLATVAGDLAALLEGTQAPRPVLVGLSIGGLFAARAILDGAPAAGLVLINTLRAPGPRLDWINAAVVRAMEEGGPNLLRDLYAPLLFGRAWLETNRDAALTGTDYAPLARDSGAYRLLSDAGAADWDVAYERLTLPTLVITGGKDCVFRVAEDVERLFARLPDARRVDLPEAGHLIPVEQPDALADALLTFADTL